MPWQGMTDNMIDRFDGRAYLDPDRIPQAPKVKEPEEICQEERQCNYERYRILAQNDFLAISEEKFLHQLHLEEQFGINAQLELEKPKKKTGGVAIGYTYEDSNEPIQFPPTLPQASFVPANNAQEADSDSDLDVDVAIDISKLDTTQAHELNSCGRHYGMKSNDFYSFLTKDADEADALKIAREEEQEKIMLSGRKSRRERRAQKERRFAGRPISPPSYAAKEEPEFKEEDKNDSGESRSPSPENSGKITYITSFGGDDELQPHSKIQISFGKQQHLLSGSTSKPVIIGQPMSYADKVKENLTKLNRYNSTKCLQESPKKPLAYQRRSYTRSRSRSRTRRTSSYSSRRRGRRSSSSRSRSRSHRNRKRTRSRSPSGRRRKRTSRSRSRSKDRRKYSRSRSRQRKSRRYSSSSSTTTSSSSTSSSRSRSRSPSRRRSPTQSPKLNRTQRSKSKSIPTTSSVGIAPGGVVASTPLGIGAGANQLLLSKPTLNPVPPLLVTVPTVPNPLQEEIKLPEPQVPIKKYYGRKRDDQSSSDEEIDLEENPTNETLR